MNSIQPLSQPYQPFDLERDPGSQRICARICRCIAGMMGSVIGNNRRVQPPSLEGRIIEMPVDSRVVSAIAAVQDDGMNLEFLSYGLRGNIDVALAAVLQNGKALYYVSGAARSSKEVALAAVSQYGLALEHAHLSFQGDIEVVLAAVRKNGLALKYASFELGNNRAIALAAIEQNSLAYAHVGERLRDNEAFIFDAMERNAEMINHLNSPDGIIGGQVRDMILTYIPRNHKVFLHIKPQFKTEVPFVLAAVSRNGLALEFVSEEMKTVAVVYAAIAQNPEVLQWIPTGLITNEMVLADIEARPTLLPLVPKEKVTYEMALAAVQANPLLLQFVPAEIQGSDRDLNIIYSALRKNPEALKFIDPQGLITDSMLNFVITEHRNNRPALGKALENLAYLLRTRAIDKESEAVFWADPLARFFNNDRELILSAIYYGVDFSVASEELKDDGDVVAEAMALNPSAIKSASVRIKGFFGFLPEV